MEEWGRLITAMVTPFDEHLQVDMRRAVTLGKKLVEEGSTALVVTGTTGEAPTLTSDEKTLLYKVLKEELDVPIIAGVGTNDTATTIAQAKAAQAVGVDGLLIVTPYYNKPPQDALYAHFKKIAEAVTTPIMLYNVPGRTGCNLLPNTVKKLAEIDNIAALKEASGDIVQFSEMVKNTPEDFTIYSGDDVMTLPSLSVGAYGVVSVASHIVGKEMQQMIQAFQEGKVGDATAIHLSLLDLYEKLFVIANPIPIKATLKLLGEDVGGVRQPLVNANKEVVEGLKKTLEKLELL
ncbi:MAG TPA: 4-hydroxy-tetrahydrodipicolinate synthase [Pseudogracilibacillus sp.]|nr:4-hydroxy-tetrahydrodipicolinate synthase [Pseudogracilibacillus sp.]